MYIDSHCHLNFKAFDQDWKEVIEGSLLEKVEMIIVGTDRQTSEKAVEIASKFSGVWVAVGFHPIHVSNRDWRAEVQYVRALAKEKKVVAIGEVGLDYYRLATATSDVEDDTSDVAKLKQDQATVFKFFLDIADEVGKPLMLHCREAEEDFLSILNSRFKIQDSVRGQWHCFSGDAKQVEKALKIGLQIGFTGLITYNHAWDEIIEALPIDRILTETDAPYLTPEPYRGQRNEPKYVKEVVKRIAEIKNIPEDIVEKETYDNAYLLYNLK
jgi:TatD DNase family protein